MKLTHYGSQCDSVTEFFTKHAPVVIKSLVVSDDKLEITLDTDKGEFKFYVSGDCCSHSWIETVDLPPFPIRGASLIQRLEPKPMPDPVQHPEHDHLQFYSERWKVHHPTMGFGEIEIEYRNSSNGYYGGDIFWMQTL